MVAASSFSVAAAATPSCSSSSSTTSCPLDHYHHPRLSFHFAAKPIKAPKLIASHCYLFDSSPLNLVSSSIIRCASASVQFTQEEAQSVQFSEDDSEQDDEGQLVEDDNDDEEDAVESQSAEAGRLYVGNLPYSMTSSQLADIFAEAGRVVSVEIVYDRVTDRSRGFAFVTMGSKEEAQEAIRMFDGSQVGGRTVKVNFPEVPKGGEREVMAPRIRSSYQGFVDSPHKIYAGNLSWVLTSEGLREAFADQAGLLSAKVVYDRDSGKSRGFGFISFATAEDMESALNAMNEAEVEGRPLRLNVAEQRVPAVPKPKVKRSPEYQLDDSGGFSSDGN